jgi:hypothetical protein
VRGRKRVVVLGCGPSGLIAALAAARMGCEVELISKKRRSEMFGAQSLHAAIPGLTSRAPDFVLRYSLAGTIDGYLSKVYGSVVPDRDGVDPSEFERVKDSWDIRAAYNRAWSIFQDKIQNHVIGLDTMEALIAEKPHLIINSVPAAALCAESTRHAFDSRQIWAVGDAPERGVFTPFHAPNNTIRYDGTPDTGWYRCATIDGYTSIEWPEDRRPPIEGISAVYKPVSNTCDCWTKSKTRVLRVGRYGRWDRRAVAHEAYSLTRQALGDKP